MTLRVGIIQSNYLPWKGYFDLIGQVELFVFHDDLQYTKNDWRNRNRIKAHSGVRWLTIPTGASERRLICDVSLPLTSWRSHHMRAIRESYGKQPGYSIVSELLDYAFKPGRFFTLSDLNQWLITQVSQEVLRLPTEFIDSRQLHLKLKKEQRVLEILSKVGANVYLSGPAAQSYLDRASFQRLGIELEWMTYGPYPEYQQPFPPFRHDVSIVDLIACTGSDAASFFQSRRVERP